MRLVKACRLSSSSPLKTPTSLSKRARQSLEYSFWQAWHLKCIQWSPLPLTPPKKKLFNMPGILPPSPGPHWMRSFLCLIVSSLLTAWPCSVHAQTLYWDANTVTDAVQEGSGTWNTSSTNWLPTNTSPSTANTNWPVSGSTTTAVFLSGANTSANYAMSVSGTINAAGLVFAASTTAINYSHTFSSGTLALANNAVIEIQGTAAANTSGFLTFNSNITGSNLTIKKTGGSVGYVQLGSTGKAWTGTLTLDSTAGDLFLRTGSINNINTLTSLNVMSGSTVSVNATGTYTPAWTIAGTGSSGRGAIRFDSTSTLSGNITLSDNATILMNSASITGTLSGNIGESTTGKSLTLSAGSITGTTIALGGSNTFTGGLIITSGGVRLDNTGALNSSSPNLVTFGNSAQSKTLTLNGSSVTAAGLVTAGGAGTSTVQNANSTPASLTLQVASSASFSGVLADGTGGGALTLIKSGAGTQTLTGNANTYTGGTVLNAGILNIAADSSLGTAPASLDTDNLTFNGGTLQLGASIVFNSNRGILLGSGGGTLDTNSFTGTYGGVISGSGSLTKSGAGTLVLNSANTYSGVTNVTAGTLSVQHNLALGSTAGGTVVTSGAKLELRNGVTVTGEGLITPSLSSAAGTNTWAGTVQAAIGSPMTFESEAGSHLIISGAVNAADTVATQHTFNLIGDGTGEISGSISNALSLVKNGTGTWTLSGNNTSSGAVTLTQGTLVMGNSGALNAATPVGVTFSSNTNAKTLRLNGYSVTVNGLGAANGTNTLTENGAATDAVLTIRNTSSSTYAGVLADGSGGGRLSLVKEGSGTEVLTGTNTYTGSTAVNQGTLELSFSAASAPASNILHSSSALKLGGGTLLLSGGSTTANSQSLNGLEVVGGSSTLSLVRNATVQNLALNLGAITHTGGSVNFILPSGVQSSVNGIITTTANNASGILGAWATVGGTAWAANDGSGNIIAYTGYTDITNFGSGAGSIGPIPNSATANVRIINGGVSGNITLAASNTTISTLLMSASGAATVGSGTAGETLRLGASGGILLTSTAGSLTIGTTAGDGSILTAGGADNTAGELVLTNHSTTNSLTVHSQINNNGSGIINLIKDGAGTLALTSVASTYSGGTSVNGGVLLVSGDRSLGSVPGASDADNLTLSNGTLRWAAAFNLDSNRGITLGASGGILDTQSFASSYGGSISGSGSLTKNGTGVLTLTNASTYTGVTTISSGVITITHSQALGSASGGTVMGSAAGLILGNNVHVSGESISLSGNYTTNNYGNLQAASGTSSVNQVSATWAGHVLLTNTNARVGAGNFSTLVISGVIQDSGAGTLNLSSSATSGTVMLSGANTYTGPTNVIRGTLKTGIANTLPATTVLTLHTTDVITDYAALDLAGNSQTIAGLTSVIRASPSSTNRTEITSASAATLTINQASNSTYYGQITGGVALVKQGAGTLTLVNQTGALSNSYTGKTTISGGTLALSGAGNLDGSPWVQIDTGATLDVSGVTGGSHTFSNKQLSGRGSVTGNLVISGTSVITPGNGTESAAIANVGSLVFNGNLTLESSASSRVTFQLGGSSTGSYDTIDINGSLLLQNNTSFTVEWTNGFEATYGTVFDLLDWNNVTWGNFNPESEVWLDLPTFTNSTLEWDVSDFLTDGIIRVGAVPEPSRVLLLMCGLLVVIARRRRVRP